VADIREGVCALTDVDPQIRIWSRRANSLQASCWAAGSSEQTIELA